MSRISGIIAFQTKKSNLKRNSDIYDIYRYIYIYDIIYAKKLT